MAKQAANVRVVMISSTALDLPRHRDQVMSACLQQNMFPKMMEHLPASDNNAIRDSLRMVDEADLYLGIIGYRYGYVPRGHKRSITEMEYERAGKRKIPRLMFLMHEDHPLHAVDVETGSGAEKLRAFRQRIGQERVIATFTSPDDLRGNVLQALSEFHSAPISEELVSSQLATSTYRVSVLNQSETVGADEVEAAVAALQIQVHRDLAPTWGIDAQLELVRTGQTPTEKSWWFHLQDDIEVDGAIAYHHWNAEGLPLGRVGINTARQAGMKWSIAASHTLLQLLVNPKGNAMVLEEDKVIPQEICRPCGGEKWAYQINSVKVSDFVLPAWFDRYRQPRSARFDYCGHIAQPFQILPDGGYLTYFEAGAQRNVFPTRKPVSAIRKARRGRKRRA